MGRSDLINKITQGDAWALLESGGWGDVGTCIFSPPAIEDFREAPNEQAYVSLFTRLFFLLKKWIRPDGAIWYVGNDSLGDVEFIPEQICLNAQRFGWVTKQRFFRPVRNDVEYIFLLTQGEIGRAHV